MFAPSHGICKQWPLRMRMNGLILYYLKVHTIDSGFDIGVTKDNKRRVTPSFKRDSTKHSISQVCVCLVFLLLQSACGHSVQQFCDLRRSSERYFTDERAFTHLLPDLSD